MSAILEKTQVRGLAPDTGGIMPDDVRAAIAAAQGSLFGISGDPDRPTFSQACVTIREWAQANLEDDATEVPDPETGEWVPIEFDPDDPCRTAADKLRALVGPELFPYVR